MPIIPKPKSKDLRPGDILGHDEHWEYNEVITVRKEDDSGWWLVSGGGLNDSSFESYSWHLKARPETEDDEGRDTTEAAYSLWHEAKFPDRDDVWVSAKLAEEAGEVNGALIKMSEGRATTDDLADEMGDALIALSVLAGRHGWTLDELRSQRAKDVLNRP